MNLVCFLWRRANEQKPENALPATFYTVFFVFEPVNKAKQQQKAIIFIYAFFKL